MALTEDRDAIIEVLQFTEKLFDLLIGRLALPDQTLFKDAWNETRPVLLQQISTLRSITSEAHPVRAALHRVGLTEKNLVLKLHYLAQAASGGWTKRVLDLLNKFLGSLAAGIPGVEPIKELKEWLETQIGDDEESDFEVTNCFTSQSFKHFRTTP